MISNIDYDIYKAIQQDKKLTEVYLGYENFDWHYAKAKYSATCTEAIDFTLFDKTICGLLKIEENLSLEQIGEILGFNVINNYSQNKYKDNAEYEILKEALQSLQDYEMIDGGDIDFSYCTLTSIGREYVAQGKKFKIHQDKEFELYFDYTSKDHSKAKENFEFIRGERAINNESEFDFEGEEYLKSFAKFQIPEIYNPEKLNSFKDPVCLRIEHFKAPLHKVYLLDIITGKLRILIFEPTGKSINEFFTEFNNVNLNNYSAESFIASKYQLIEHDSQENKIGIDLNDYQEKINLASEVSNPEEVINVVENYYQHSLYIEPTKFFNEISKFTTNSTKEIWLLLKEISKREIDILKDLIENNSEKSIFIYIENNEVSQRFSEQINNDIKKYSNVYILLMDSVSEFNILFKNINGDWTVFKEEKFDIPIRLNGELNQLEKVFIYRNITNIDLEENYLNDYRIEFAKEYTPLIHSQVSLYLNDLNLENEISIKKLKELKSIDNRIKPFKEIDQLNSFFAPLENKKQECIQVIIDNREQKIKLSIEKVENKLTESKQPTISFIEKLENQLNKEKDKCLEEEFGLFADLETKLKVTKKDLELASKRKSIIIDTNVLLDEPNIIEIIGNNQTIVFSGKVIDELDFLKTKPDLEEKAYKAIRNIKRHQSDKNISFNFGKVELLPDDFDKKSPDNKIISVLIQYKRKNPILLTNDNGMHLKAKMLDIPAKTINELKTILDLSKSQIKNRSNKKYKVRK